MVGQGFIDRMKDGSVIINTSRGGVMDQDTVTRSLRSGKLGGAILDVFENEPEVPSCLKEMENVLLTPHMAGGTRTSRRTCVENALLNVYDVLTGSPPRNAINEKSAIAK
jgi:lactate dehydrogenase-like 2-hydroxyacid dehydrogenase